MKIARIAGALVAVTVAAAVSAQDVRPVPSKVTEATVFMRGAELTHTASASLKKGANEIFVEGLSPSVDAGSVKVTIGGNVVVSAFEYSIDYLSSAKTPPARLKALKDSIDIYTAQLAGLDVDIKVNAGMQGYLETGIAKNVSGSEAGLGIDELRKTMDYYKAKSEEILNGARELQKRRSGTSAALARVRNQHNEEAGLAGRNSGVLRLNLSAPAAGTYPLVITYYTPSAGWTPYYDINVASTDKPVRIAARSRVVQATGLDWENVRLTLSTSVPSGGKTAPLFSTWFLREQQDLRMMEDARARSMQNAYSYPAEMAEMAAPEAGLDEVVVVGYGGQRKAQVAGAAPAIYDHVTSAGNALNVTYNIDLPYSIPGNGKAQNIDLATREAAAEYRYYCAPRLDGATYLIAEIADWEQLELLSGTANVTYDGTYVGETFIDASATHEKLTLTLGTDKRVGVTRELAREFSATRAIGNNTEQTFAYRLTVRNSQTRPVFLVLKDQYPVSADRNIVVTLDARTTTPPTANREDVGVVTWEGELSAGEVKTYMLSYTVKYPKEMNLNL